MKIDLGRYSYIRGTTLVSKAWSRDGSIQRSTPVGWTTERSSTVYSVLYLFGAPSVEEEWDALVEELFRAEARGEITHLRFGKRAWVFPPAAVIEQWAAGGEYRAPDGCLLEEPSGVCQHGVPTWAVLAGGVRSEGVPGEGIPE